MSAAGRPAEELLLPEGVSLLGAHERQAVAARQAALAPLAGALAELVPAAGSLLAPEQRVELAARRAAR